MLLTSLALTTAGTHAQEQTARLVKDANLTRENLPAGIEWIEPIGQGQNVVFPKDTLASGKELWTSDGTAAGTRLLKDIAPGPGGSHPQQGISFGTGAGARVAFLTQRASYIPGGNAPSELALWVTDGTEAGTVRIFESAMPDYLGDTYLRAGTTNGVFIEDSSWITNGRELFFSDGTVAGTRSLNPFVGGVRKFSNPQGYTTSGSWCYFIANGNDVWRSDGTDAGTTKLTTFTGLSPKWGLVVGENLFVNVVVQSGVSSELWVCPAAGGTATRVGPPDGTPWRWVMEMNSVGDELVFVIQDETTQTLWATDGTTAGTHRIPLTLSGQSAESKMGYTLTKWQDALYFSTTQSGVAVGVWRTDGTTAGTTLLNSIKSPYGVLDDMWAGADGVYFARSSEKGYQLWRTAGTAASTQALKGTPYIASPTGPLSPAIVTPVNSTVYFLSAQQTADEFLCRPKNSKGGTLQLTRPETINGGGVPPHPAGAPPYEMLGNGLLEFVFAGRSQELWQIDLAKGKSRSLFKLSLPGTIGFRGTTPKGALFSRYVARGPAEVYVTNGTKGGTVSLSADAAATSHDFVKAGDLWFFSPAYPGSPRSSSVFKTDGTLAGTALVKATDGTEPSRLGNMVAFQGSVWFIAATSDGKRALWRSNGTPAGTVRVANTWYGDANETVRNLSAAGGKLYFSIAHSGKEYLWQSDGTTAGTVEVSSTTTFSALVSPAVDLAGLPIFQAKQTSASSTQWWAVRDGGISVVTSKPIDSAASTAPSFPKYAVAGSQLFFNGNTDGDVELWVTNGTTAGTHLVKDINPGTESSEPINMLAVGDEVYFIAFDDDHGRELWRSDGTEAGTVLVADVEPGPTSSWPTSLKTMGGKLYFSATRRATGWELHSVDLPQ